MGIADDFGDFESAVQDAANRAPPNTIILNIFFIAIFKLEG